jgi:hypothetical protein
MKPSDPDAPKPAKQTPPNQGSLLGKPVVKAVITPDMRDRIIVVRRDIRRGYKVPKQGQPFKGVDEKETAEGYIFATVQYPEPPGVYVDEFYVKSRKDQERYNWDISYPYVDKHYPQITRTYVCLRSDNMVIKEAQSDDTDPTSDDLFLTDHKIERIENDPVLDALFVKVIRVFERLPSPIIISKGANQYQQDVTIATQEIVSGPMPPQSALTEEVKQERTGTAKAKNTIATVPRVFPLPVQKKEVPSMTRELWLGGFFEVTASQVTAGSIVPPTVGEGVYSKTIEQLTEYKIKTTVQALPLPQFRQHKEMGGEAFGGSILTEYLTIDTPESGLDVPDDDPSYWLTVDAKMRNLAEVGRIKKVTKVPAGQVWPTLHTEKVLTEGIYAGIRILIDKTVVPAHVGGIYANPVTPNPGGYTDMQAHDKWRTIQITSRIDVGSLPKPITYAGTHPLNIPPTLLTIEGVYGDRGGKSQTVSRDGLTGEGVSVSVDSGPLGTILHTSRENFRGNAVAEITRIFTTTPPSIQGSGIRVNGVTYFPFKFLPATGTATMFSTYSRFSGSQNGDVGGPARGSSSSDQGQIRVQTTEFRPMLTGACQILNDTFQGASNAAGATTTDGLYHVEMFQPGNTCRMTVRLGASTPSVAPASGTKLLMVVDVKEWRYKVWVVHLVQVVVP